MLTVYSRLSKALVGTSSFAKVRRPFSEIVVSLLRLLVHAARVLILNLPPFSPAGVTATAFKQIEAKREASGRRIRFFYFRKERLLFITIPTGYHERGHTILFSAVLHEFWSMGLGWRSRRWSSSIRFKGKNLSGSGEGDSGCIPTPPRRGDDWPTLVIEAGHSQSVTSLRRKMRWWFSESNHKVKIAILVKLFSGSRHIRLEKYTEDVQQRPGAMLTRNATIVPHLRQTITITPIANTNPVTYNVTRGALELEFDRLFLRLPDQNRREHDVTIDVDALKYIAEEIWL